MSDHKWIVRLDGTELPSKQKIGGKAWSIAQMRALGLVVPPAFVIGTRACLAYLDNGDFPDGLAEEMEAGIAWLESESMRNFGGARAPLLLSVRSGAAISMPGMMDTVLNLGIDEDAEAALAAETGLADFAHDTHRRFLELYAAIVLKASVDHLEADADVASWRATLANAGAAVPRDVREQLRGAIRAVFDSWNTRRAKRYRDHNGIPHDLGTAVTVQAMVFGNLDERSGTGVLFSRNPLTGERKPYGEYLPRAQGEDVVSGKFTPLALDALLEREPQAHAELLAASTLLETEHRDMQDIEFTVQSGKLYLLQARSAKRAPDAAVRSAVEMVDEGLIDIETALSRISPEQIRTLLLPRLRDGATATAQAIAKGEGACPGVASGIFVTDSDEAERRAAAGDTVILVRKTTSPDDVHGMIAARAVVTEQGGSTSHAAVVSRALGRPCVVGVGDVSTMPSGSSGTVDGAGGTVYAGALAVDIPDESHDVRLTRLIGWARERNPVRVLRPDEAPHVSDCIDLDARLVSGDPQELPSLLVGVETASGSMLSDPAAARIAVEHGVKTIITNPILPALLGTLGAAA